MMTSFYSVLTTPAFKTSHAHVIVRLFMLTALAVLPFHSFLYGQSFTRTDSLQGVEKAAAAWGDFDNDNDLDLLLTGVAASGNITRLYRNHNNTFEKYVDLEGVGEGSVDWGDYDNDGDLDILLTGQQNTGNITKIYRNNGGSFTELETSLPAISTGAGVWGDFDNDGDLDILLVGSARGLGAIAKVFRNDRGIFNEHASLLGVRHAAAAWGDYDNDGYLDILIGGEHDQNTFIAKVYHNIAGNFNDTTAALDGIGINQVVAAWGDYDGDGRLDILLAGHNEAQKGSAKVYHNEGNHTFKNIGAALVGIVDAAGAWGDFDNDGRLDIFLAGKDNSSSGERFSRIYRNLGGNQFKDIETPLVGVARGVVACGDYDNDDKLDVLLAGDRDIGDIAFILRNNVAARNTSPTPPTNPAQSVEENNVTLRWEKSTDQETGQNGLSYNLRVGKTPGGEQVMAAMSNSATGYRRLPKVGNTNHNNQWTLRNLPRGTYFWRVQAIDHAYKGSDFAPEMSFAIAKPLPPQNLIAIPGLQQVTLRWSRSHEPGLLRYRIYGGTSPNPATVIDSTASSMDTTKTLTGLNYRETYYFRITVMDSSLMNVSNFSREVIATPALFTASPATLERVQNSAVAWGDYDNDGDLDILLAGSSITRVYRNDGGERFVNIKAALVGVDGSSVAWGDYDNDGDLDILLTGSGLARVYRNDNGEFKDANVSLPGIENGAVAWADFDNDGDLDIILTGTGLARIYRNDGKIFKNANMTLPETSNSSVACGDYDNDGDVDILLADPKLTRIYENSDGAFKDIFVVLPGITDGSAVWDDYDGDGDLDILLTGSGLAKVYKNEKKNFVEVQSLLALSNSSAAWGDYDNDGKMDILLTGETSSGPVAKIYRNHNGDFQDINQTLTGAARGAVAWGNYDNDGDLDILITGQSNDVPISVIYRNEIESANTAPAMPLPLPAKVVGRSVTLSWHPASDLQTTPKGLTYNVRLGRTPGGQEIVAPMSNLVTGYHLIPQFGNTSYDTSWTFKNLPEGTYYWSVQAIDHLYAGSPFSAEQSFPIKTPPQPQNLRALAGNEEATLRWDRSTSSGIRGYRIYMDTNPAPLTLIDSTASVNATTTTIQRLTNGVTYHFRITALDSISTESDFSAEVDVTPGLITDISAELTGIAKGATIWGDYDNDGDLDLLVLGGTITDPLRSTNLYKNVDGRFEKVKTELRGMDDGAAAWGDYDNDGDLDILLNGQVGDDIYRAEVYRNDGNDHFKEINAGLLGTEDGTALWGDYDNDGDPDILLSGQDVVDGMELVVTRLYRNEGHDQFVPVPIPLEGASDSAMAWGDYDNDGDLDLILTGKNQKALTHIYDNDNGNFTPITTNLPPLKDGSAAWADYDNDGDLDLLLTGSMSSGKQNDARIYRNDGNGNFAFIEAKLRGVRESDALWGDLDNDGDLDILLTGNAEVESIKTNVINITRVYQNKGGDKFDSLNVALVNVRASTGAWGDYDNDRDLDFVVAGLQSSTSHVARIYRNNFSTKPNTPPAAPANLVSAVIGNAVTLSWDKSTDSETAAKALTYNLRLGTTPGGGEIVSPMANATNGFRRVVQPGNANLSNRWTIKNLPEGIYYWSVQTIDNAFAGSAFAPERIFRIGAAALAPSQTSLDFGEVTARYKGNLLLQLTNTGSAALTVQRVSLSGPDAGAFSHERLQNFSLQPGQSHEVSVQFMPGSEGPKTATLNFEYDASNTPLTVALSGKGVLEKRPFLELRTRTLDFASVFASETKTDTLHLFNAGAENLRVTSVAIEGINKENFGIFFNPFSIPAGDSETVIVNFQPGLQAPRNQIEEKTAQLVIRHDAPNGPGTINLRGRVIATAVDLKPVPFDLGVTNVGNSAEESLTISNNGLQALRVTSLQISGRDSTRFFVDIQPDLIGPNQSQKVTLKFSPQAPVKSSAVLRIKFDLPAELPRAVPLSGMGVDREPPQITNAIPAKPVVELSEALTVSANVTDNVQVKNVSLKYRHGGQKNGTEKSIQMTGDAGSTKWEATISGGDIGERGLEFMIEATDGDSVQQTKWRSVSVKLPGKKLSSRPQQGGTEPSAYRMISFPLKLETRSVRDALKEDLGNPSIKNWRLWEINSLLGESDPTNRRPFRELLEVGDFDLSPGNAYFLIMSKPKTLTNRTGVTIKTEDRFRIPLETGYNMIGSPFAFNIPIQNVEPESLASHLQSYEGAWEITNQSSGFIRPWEGYLIKVKKPDTLFIYPSEEIRQTLPKSEPSEKWSIRIAAFCQRARDTYNFAGVAPEAAMEWDRYERFEPPLIGDFVTVSFPHLDWEKYPDVYTTDFHPPSEEGQEWDFTVDTNLPGQPVTLRFEDLGAVPEEFEVHLFDAGLKIMQNLREEAEYIFVSSRNGDAKKLRLLVGTPTFIQQYSDEALGIPTTYQVSQNFPNPFNPSTTIRYGLPEAERVRLVIYNLLGEEVVKLIDNEPKKAGYHVAIWNGRNRDGRLAASGLYIYRLRAGEFVMTKKMALLK